MVKYSIRRILMVIPLMIFVLYALHTLIQHFPVDPVVQSLINQGVDEAHNGGVIDSQIYLSEKMKLGLDKPEFYISISPSNRLALIPTINWHGVNNQFHRWIVKLSRLDFGISSVDGKPTWEKTIKAVTYTLQYMIPALLLTYLLSFLIGLMIGKLPNHWFSLLSSGMFYALSAIPLFWLATLAVIYLTTPLYSQYLDLFPRVDIYFEDGFPRWYYALPISIIVLQSVAYYSTQVKNIYKDTYKSVFMHSIKAKGISSNRILVHHTIPNMMIPLSTLMTLSVPTILSGSIVIEQIFNIPGVGRLLLQSIQSSDWTVVVPIIIIVGLTITLSYLLGDLIYALLDPRIKQQFQL